MNQQSTPIDPIDFNGILKLKEAKIKSPAAHALVVWAQSAPSRPLSPSEIDEVVEMIQTKTVEDLGIIKSVWFEFVNVFAQNSNWTPLMSLVSTKEYRVLTSFTLSVFIDHLDQLPQVDAFSTLQMLASKESQGLIDRLSKMKTEPDTQWMLYQMDEKLTVWLRCLDLLENHGFEDSNILLPARKVQSHLSDLQVESMVLSTNIQVHLEQLSARLSRYDLGQIAVVSPQIKSNTKTPFKF